MGEQEEKETPQTENTTQQEVADEPKETDKMLEKKDDETKKSTEKLVEDKKKSSSKPSTPTTEKKDKEQIETDQTKSNDKGEEIIDIPEGGDVGGDKSEAPEGADERKLSAEEREVKPKKIPIGGLKLPGFFMKSKPKSDSDGAEGELLEKENKEGEDGENKSAKKDEKPGKNFGQRLRNFFVRKPAEKQAKQQASSAPETDNKSEATAEAAEAETNEQQIAEGPPKKRGLLNAIKLPIANIVPKKKSDDDAELGMGKAGLASMETLDDSLKDQDCVDKASTKNNGVDEIAKLKKSPSGEIKQASDEKSPEEVEVQPVSFCQRLRSYKCSVDDALIALGILLFVLLIAVIGYVLSHETLTSPPIREGRYMDAVTGCGMVEGLKEDGAFAFRGIPFALAPVGDRRWRRAQEIKGIDDCWNGTLKAHNSSELCTQRLGNGTVIGSEDCLYLDVITPHVRYDNPLPVIVMIGAESLTGPSPGVLRPSARYSRSHDVIFVRPNFRLGVLGFLALETLTKDTYPHSSGNYALSDIIAALKWIKLNIGHFGGDPKSITLLGHRAGATLISALVTSTEAQDLYTRAWVSSASAILPGKPLAEYEKRNQEIMKEIDCLDAACLRNITSDKLWDATPDTWLHFPLDIPTIEENSTAHHEWLAIDGEILKEHPAESWKKEYTGNPKLVMGTTAHESHTDKLHKRYNWTAAEIRNFIQNSKIGALNLTDEAIERYNATNYRALISMITDIRTICPLLTNARLQPSVPFYVVTQGEGEDQLATVDADVQAILGRYEPHTVEQRRFVSSMQQLFYYYVSHGTMPQYEPRRRVLNIGQDPLSQEDYPNCNFWISNDIVPRYARID